MGTIRWITTEKTSGINSQNISKAQKLNINAKNQNS